MSNILEKIVEDKKREVEKRLGHITSSRLQRLAVDNRTPLDFRESLRGKGLSVIAEVKKASPSKGVIRPDFEPLDIAMSYREGGASCLSVLTEEKYFQGKPEYLSAIRKAVDIPILRKDFIIDNRQIRESYDLGADAILLIVAILTDEQLSVMLQLSADFQLTVLVEIHTEKELSRALGYNCPLIGINNRNLTTFETDIQHSIDLRRLIPQSTTCVSESGIKDAQHCDLLQKNGFDAILVGETLMRQPDPGAYIASLLGKTT